MQCVGWVNRWVGGWVNRDKTLGKKRGSDGEKLDNRCSLVGKKGQLTQLLNGNVVIEIKRVIFLHLSNVKKKPTGFAI